MEQPLAGARVVEVGGTLAVAGTAKPFADYGAEVVKVEPPGGAAMRRLPPFDGDQPGLERGAYHIALDTGKLSVALDVCSPSGREVLGRLAVGADLVFLDLPPDETAAVIAAIDRAAAARGVTPPSTVALSPHGLDGPLAGRRENDASIFAWSTRMRRHAMEGMEPLRYAPNVATLQWASTAAAVGVAALWGRERDGEARRVEVAGVEALLGNVDVWFLLWEFLGGETPREGGQSKLAYPAGCYRCADGYVVFAAANEPFFSRLCEGIGRPELAGDPRFASPVEKPQHWDEFMQHLGPWLEARTRDEVFTTLQQYGVMVAPLLDVSEVLRDPQAVARGSFVEVGRPGGGPATTIAGPPFRMAEAWEARPAPVLGEHTIEALDALGYSRDEQIALFRAGVTG